MKDEDQAVVEAILEDRTPKYGPWWQNGVISQDLKKVMHSSPNWATSREIMHPAALEVLDLMCIKFARILSGDPELIDNWDDIAGYAMLEARRLRDKEAARPIAKGTTS